MLENGFLISINRQGIVLYCTECCIEAAGDTTPETIVCICSILVLKPLSAVTLLALLIEDSAVDCMYKNNKNMQSLNGFIIFLFSISCIIVSSVTSRAAGADLWLMDEPVAVQPCSWFSVIPDSMLLMTGLAFTFVLAFSFFSNRRWKLVQPAALVRLNPTLWQQERAGWAALPCSGPETLPDLCSCLWHSLICRSWKLNSLTLALMGEETKCRLGLRQTPPTASFASHSMDVHRLDLCPQVCHVWCEPVKYARLLSYWSRDGNQEVLPTFASVLRHPVISFFLLALHAVVCLVQCSEETSETTLRESSEEEWAELVSIKSYWCSSIHELEGFASFCDLSQMHNTDVQCFSYLTPTLTPEQKLIQHIHSPSSSLLKKTRLKDSHSCDVNSVSQYFFLSAVLSVCAVFPLMDSLWRRWVLVYYLALISRQWATHLSRPCEATVTAAQSYPRCLSISLNITPFLCDLEDVVENGCAIIASYLHPGLFLFLLSAHTQHFYYSWITIKLASFTCVVREHNVLLHEPLFTSNL